MFSEPSAFSGWFGEKTSEILLDIRTQFPSPEHINDSPVTAPSKRILKECERYEKPVHGSLIALDIGLETIRRECFYFNRWLEHLESLE